MNVISGNLVSKISDQLPQFLIVYDLKINYKILNYYKNDFSKLMRRNLSMISHFYTGLTSQVIMWMLTLNLIFSMIRYISQFINYHVPHRKFSKQEIKVSTKAWITKYILAKIRYKDKLYSKINNKHSNPTLI